MVTLGLLPIQTDETVLVQDEPALEIALPQVFERPALTVLQRGRLPHVEGLVAKVYRAYRADPARGLGPDYQLLVREFEPLFAWALACWDYLLSTEGCRFLPRVGDQKAGARGDYRAATDGDYSRMVHGLFRACVLEFAQQPAAPSLAAWLRERIWPLILDAYRRLDQPPDPRQRTLTAYSYLRCVPYEFLNPFHQDLVYRMVQQLPPREWEAIRAYFLHFFTEAATAEALGCPLEEGRASLRQGLTKLLVEHRLVYCLLRQIERY
jgi:hypothetical protein